MRHLLVSAVILSLLGGALPAYAQATIPSGADPDQLFNNGLFTDPTIPGIGTGGTTIGQDYFSAETLVAQGAKLAKYSAYLEKLSTYAANNGAPKEVAGQLQIYAQDIGLYSEQLLRAQSVQLRSDIAAIMLANSTAMLGTSLRLVGENTDSLQSGDIGLGMLQIGQTLRRVATNMKQVADAARDNGGNLDLTVFTRQLQAVDYLLVATRYLNSSLSSGRRVNANIDANVASDRGSAYQLISFSGLGSSDPLGTIDRTTGYFWDFGDGEFATGAFVTHLYTKADTYVVYLYVLGPSGFGLDKTEIRLQPARPTAVISTDKEPLIGPHDDVLTVVQNEGVLFSGKNSFDPSTPNPAFKFRWDFGDGTTDDILGATVLHAYTEPGTYEVQLLVENADGIGSMAKKVLQVLPTPPSAAFRVQRKGDSLRADPAKDFFVDHVDGQTTLVFDASASLGAPSANGVRTKLVEAHWSFGDGATATQTERELATGSVIEHVYAQPGRYDVTLTVTDNLQMSSDAVKTVYLLAREVPSADFAIPRDADLTTHIPLRFDGTASRSNFSQIRGYAWELRPVKQPSMKTGTSSIFEVTIDRPGSYEVVLQTTDASGQTSDPVVQGFQVVSSPPRAAFTFTREPDAPNTYQFDASTSFDPDTGDTLSYSWDFDSDGTYDLLKRSTPTAQYTFGKVGPNPVTLRVTDSANRSATSVRTVDVDATLAATIAVDPSTPAAGDGPLTVNFVGSAYLNLPSHRDTNNIRSIDWDFGDGVRKTAVPSNGVSRVSHTFASSDSSLSTFTVAMTATDAYGKKRRASTIVTVGPPNEVIPLLHVRPELPERGNTLTEYVFSAKGSVSARGLTTGLEAHWDFGDGSGIATGMLVRHRFTSNGTFIVTLTVTDPNNDQVARTTRAIEVLRAPPIALFTAGPMEGAAPLLVRFDATLSRDPGGSIKGYVWDFGDGVVLQQPTPTISHEYPRPGTYTVVLTILDSTGSKVRSDAGTILVR